MRKLQDSASLVSRTRGNPFLKNTTPETKPPDPKPQAEPPAKKLCAPVVPDVYRLPTYDPAEFASVTYCDAWQQTEEKCAAYPVVWRENPPLEAPLLLVQMQDTLGSVARLTKWVQQQWHTTRLFAFDDEPVFTFLSLLQTARTFVATRGGDSVAVAFFWYPTAYVLEELCRELNVHKRFTNVKIIVVLDDVYCSMARELRAKATVLFVEPLPKDASNNCLLLLQRAWRLPLARKEYWLARAGSDPRMLLHMLYFDRLLYATAGVAWGFQLNLDIFAWVHVWFWHGFQQLQELHYAAAPPAAFKTTFGVVAHQIRGNGAVSVVAWDYAVAKLPPPDTKNALLTEELDVNLALAYLHWAAPLATARLVNNRVMDAVAATCDVLSDAELLQNRWNPTILPLHQGAVRLGAFRILKTGHHAAWDEGWRDAPKKSFYEWLDRQRGGKKRAYVHEYAPLVVVHRQETLARLLFMADPTRKVTYWPRKVLKNALAYATEADIEFSTSKQDVAWRLVWRLVEDYALKHGSVPTRPDTAGYTMPASAPRPIMAACGHTSAFAWCVSCGTAPAEPVFRCPTHCRGWGACLVCSAQNQILADVVACARALT